MIERYYNLFDPAKHYTQVLFRAGDGLQRLQPPRPAHGLVARFEPCRLGHASHQQQTPDDQRQPCNATTERHERLCFHGISPLSHCYGKIVIKKLLSARQSTPRQRPVRRINPRSVRHPRSTTGQ